MYRTGAAYQFKTAMCLNTALQLSIPDKVSNYGRPITLRELATALQLHPIRTASLYQLMRFLVFNGLFSMTTLNEEDAYVLSPSSHLLLREVETTITTAISSPPSLYGIFAHFHDAFLKAWINLGKWFLSDEPITPFKFAHGISFWEYVNGSPDGHSFNEIMEMNSKKFIASSDFKTCLAAVQGLESLVDVGGGTGVLAKAIYEFYPHLKCIVLDRPEVIDKMPQPTQGNVSFIRGDMFQCIPPADAVLMKWILHDWDDEKCLSILKNCKNAIAHKGERGKIIIIEAILDEEDELQELARIKFGYDMQMMLLFNGKERSEREWKKLIMEAGFSHYQITPLLNDFRSLIQVFP